MFEIGTKVRLKHTGDIGKVTALLELGIVNVYLEGDDMEIPVSEYDLESLEDATLNTAAPPPPIIPKPIPKPTKSIPLTPTPLHSVEDLGIQLAFKSIALPDGSVDKYLIYLLNGNAAAVLSSITLSFAYSTPKTIHNKINSSTSQLLGEMRFDQLNDAPVIDIECRQITTMGTGKPLRKNLKIKAKQFFKKRTSSPFFEESVYVYDIFKNLDATKPKSKPQSSEEDLKTYTKRNAAPLRKKSKYKHFNTNNVQEFADFNNELDLHIENISPRHAKLSNSEKLRIQLLHFDTFLEKAIRLGVERVFVIHGIGKGKLKNEIATRLIQHPDVDTFKNEYHPRYGYGATEILF